jgi:hypothetical protein
MAKESRYMAIFNKYANKRKEKKAAKKAGKEAARAAAQSNPTPQAPTPLPQAPAPIRAPPTAPGGQPLPTSLIFGLILIVVIAIVAFFAVSWLLPQLGTSEFSLFGMAAPGGSGGGGLLQVITSIIGYETQPVSGEKAIAPTYTGATTPYYAFRIKEVKSIPTVGLMQVLEKEILGTTFRVTSVAENTGDKKANNLFMFVTPGIPDSFCESGTDGLLKPRVYDVPNTESCDTTYVDEEGIALGIGDINNSCSWIFDLEKSQRVQKTCKLRFACQMGGHGCWCDIGDDGVIDWENCGVFNQGYTPKLNVFLVGPYVSTTRLDVQFIDSDYFRLLDIHQAPTSIQLPIRSKNSWGAISMWLDAGYETRQPIISGQNEVFLFRLQFENPQGGILMTSPDTEIASGMIAKTLETVTIRDVYEKVYGAIGDDQFRSDLYFLIPTVMVPTNKKTGNIYCGDEIKSNFCSENYDIEEFKEVKEDYCKAAEFVDTYKGSTQSKYTICKFMEPEESTGTSGKGVDLKNCFGKCEYFLNVPLLDPGINRETFIIRADLLYYYTDVKPFIGITTVSEIGTGVE